MQPSSVHSGEQVLRDATVNQSTTDKLSPWPILRFKVLTRNPWRAIRASADNGGRSRGRAPGQRFIWAKPLPHKAESNLTFQRLINKSNKIYHADCRPNWVCLWCFYSTTLNVIKNTFLLETEQPGDGFRGKPARLVFAATNMFNTVYGCRIYHTGMHWRCQRRAASD